MAKDVASKTASNANNNSPPISDQQKVPPLRIVLNTSGNQKSSSSAIASTTNPQQQQQQQQQDLKRERTQDARADGTLKTGGRVRIKLGTNRNTSKTSTSSEAAEKNQTEDGSRSKSTIAEKSDNLTKEEIHANYSHLRRITRRSQRSVQTVNNEDEESISSMTSTDENQNTTNNTNSDINSVQESTVLTSSQSNAGSSVQTTNSNTGNSSSTYNSETPRRHKRRKGETSESQTAEQDGLLGFQNYKLPAQNSFELYKNIRKQVDKRLKSLDAVHPKTPYGFRDYMIARGAYLLDGNKLGNGTNLYMNEEGGLHSIPISKYHAIKYNRLNYSVPNRAKVPLGLPVNSPLYTLFIEQEKERYRMQIQHLKEREKLTLAAEQEIVRVYNQAAMAAVNQLEPFSACTMLKHQEIYNYMDSDGVTIQSSEDDQLDQIKQEGVRTRRRQHEQISPPPSRKNSNADESQTLDANQKEIAKSPERASTADEAQTENSKQMKETTIDEPAKEKLDTDDSKRESPPKIEEENIVKDEVLIDEKNSSSDHADKKVVDQESGSDSDKSKNVESSVTNDEEKIEESDANSNDKKDVKQEPLSDDKSPEGQVKMELDDKTETSETKDLDSSAKTSSNQSVEDESPQINEEKTAEQNQPENQKPAEQVADSASSETVATEDKDKDKDKDKEGEVPMDQDASNRQADETELVLTDDDRKAYNKEVFLSQLHDIDDKWDKIRGEMLIRHRNEAESLYAVQKLEWEWKTKEIGACDIRTTPVIDNTLVPKLSIYSQDY